MAGTSIFSVPEMAIETSNKVGLLSLAYPQIFAGDDTILLIHKIGRTHMEPIFWGSDMIRCGKTTEAETCEFLHGNL